MSKIEKTKIIEDSKYQYCGALEDDEIVHRFAVKATGEVYTLIQSPYYTFQIEDFDYICVRFEAGLLKYSSMTVSEEISPLCAH